MTASDADRARRRLRRAIDAGDRLLEADPVTAAGLLALRDQLVAALDEVDLLVAALRDA